jgi:2-hydroxy-3-oxopropionate reductase
MTRIGYIGLGLMGSAMTRNLMKAGFSLVVHNRSRAIVDQLVSEGAKAANSPKEVAQQVDFVCTNLPDSPDVEQVVFGPNGIIEGVHDGLIYMDNSTIKPETARKIAAELAKVNVQVLDAPVSGGQIGAQNGTLVFMVGGPQETFDKAEPLFKAMGKSWTLVGDSGAGQIAKAANQIMVGAQMAAMGELLVFAQKCGVDPFKVVEAIKGGAAQCWTLDNKPPRLAQGIRTPGFKAYMQLKDLNIIRDTGKTYGVPLPVSQITRNMFQEMIDMGNGEQDNAAVLCILEKETGLHVGPVSQGKEK